MAKRSSASGRSTPTRTARNTKSESTSSFEVSNSELDSAVAQSRVSAIAPTRGSVSDAVSAFFRDIDLADMIHGIVKAELDKADRVRTFSVTKEEQHSFDQAQIEEAVISKLGTATGRIQTQKQMAATPYPPPTQPGTGAMQGSSDTPQTVNVKNVANVVENMEGVAKQIEHFRTEISSQSLNSINSTILARNLRECMYTYQSLQMELLHLTAVGT